eukprot:TRINITY_DN558_c1_g1_i1.p1 TRINITY_DN558_c1_g1~~TRINITY_DN558_c1_g1_i1.p1  ORF type:complete len:539 (+),score=67.66 TRINITY_DN558_c1_g1_i1:211-1827(+)
MDWKGVSIEPPVKCFRSEHPNVAAMTRREVDTKLLQHGIEIWHVGENRPRDMPKPVDCFEEAFIPDWAEKVLRDRSYKQPTPIQIQAWSAACLGYDMLAIACTGSGKTMAYTLPMIQHVTAQQEVKPGQGPIGLILVPSRELCQQVSQEIQSLLSEARQCDESAPQIRVASVFGGNGGDYQYRNMLGQFDVMVACPGRLLDAISRGDTNLHRASYIVVDEADDLLTDATSDIMNNILCQIRPPDYRQLLLFSATHQDSILEAAKTHCTSPFFQITVGGLKLSACSDIEQHFWPYSRTNYWKEGETKVEALLKAVKMIPRVEPPDKSLILIFVNRLESVQHVVDAIKAEGLEVSGIHARLDQLMRDRLLQEFINGHIRILVSTNLLGRGIDVPDIKWVINYDMPEHLTDYVHRIGRTGRAGRKGVALTLLDELDLRHSRAIEDVLKASGGHKIPEWLERESKCFKKYWKKYYDKRREERGEGPVREDQKAAVDNPKNPKEPFPMEWHGRGGPAASRLEEVLAMTGGLGICMPGMPVCLK